MNHTKTDRIWPARLFAFPILQLKFSMQRWAVPTEVCPNCNSMSKANALFEATEFRSNLLCSYCCCSVAQLCLTLCHPVDCSTPGFPVLHYLPEFTQTHVHWVGDAIQPSHTLLSPSPPAFNLSQNQGLFLSQLFTSSGQNITASASASVLPMNIQGWFPLGLTDLIFLQPKGLSRVFSSTTVRRHQFFGAQPFLLSHSHICIWPLKKT